MAPPDPSTAMVQLNSKVSIPEYSSLKVGTKYMAWDGKEATEIYDGEDWIFLVETTLQDSHHKNKVTHVTTLKLGFQYQENETRLGSPIK